MERLERIPMPPGVRWREFRIRILPVIVFGITGIIAALLWRNGTGGAIAAIGEASQALVSAPQAGVIETVLVEPYEMIEIGQPLATFRPADSRATFDRLQAELAFGRLLSQPSVAEENAMNFERIRVELLRLQSELAIARVKLERADSDLARASSLHRQKLLSDELFDLSRQTRDALRAEVETKSSAVGTIEGRLTELTALGVPKSGANTATNALMARLQAVLNEAKTNLAPITLIAGRAGMVQQVFRQAGESVVPGESLFSVSPLRSERIVGFLRQPYPTELTVGMPVEVVTREHRRRTFDSRVVQVGARLEVITNALAFVRPSALVDSGLPFVVHLPEEIDLRPGELVDLRLKGSASSLLDLFRSRRANEVALRTDFNR